MSQERPALRLLPGVLDARAEWAWFCGHCAAPSPGGEPPAPMARVCRSCGLGLLLETRLDSLPTSRDAFVVVDAQLLVQAMSRRAEQLLGVAEDLAVRRPVSNLLVPADAEAGRSVGFAAAVAEAVSGGDEPAGAFVRPWNTFGVRMRARIAPCGPPRAALLVLDDRPKRPLKAVEDR
jgi:PAS domain-containing protein